MLIDTWHFSFTVSDIEQSVKFYRDVLGMELMHEQEQANAYTRKFVGYPDAHLKVAQLKIEGKDSGRSGHLLELVEYVAPRGQKVDTSTPNPGTAHLAFEVDDIAAQIHEFQENGVQMIHKEGQAGADNAQIAFAHPKSFSGVLVELKEKCREK